MSGHSKWHNIQAKKGVEDAKRGRAFTKIHAVEGGRRKGQVSRYA